MGIHLVHGDIIVVAAPAVASAAIDAMASADAGIVAVTVAVVTTEGKGLGRIW